MLVHHQQIKSMWQKGDPQSETYKNLWIRKQCCRSIFWCSFSGSCSHPWVTDSNLFPILKLDFWFQGLIPTPQYINMSTGPKDGNLNLYNNHIIMHPIVGLYIKFHHSQLFSENVYPRQCFNPIRTTFGPYKYKVKLYSQLLLLTQLFPVPLCWMTQNKLKC
jgi:hypothetical protein